MVLIQNKQYWILISIFVVSSCVHELPFPNDGNTGNGNGGGTIPLATCSKDTVYFNNVILPLINSTCGKSGCHGSVNRGAFSLTTYSKIVDKIGTVSQLNNALNEMADEKQDQPNLDYTAPTPDQMTLLDTWIAQGAKNNTCNGCDTTQFTFTAIIKPIMDTYCLGCHNGPGGSAGVDLSTYTAIKSELTFKPGRLLGSVEWTGPYTGSKQMPQGGSKLPDCYVIQIRNWINAGALNN